MTCPHASFPEEKGLDGSGSCRTFLAIHCALPGAHARKNMPCRAQVAKKEDSNGAA
ncbi:MAG: hypothetical protein HZB29_04885 [Nitrospinae bacterium]|nr:hypothetical protein [Nitrospinota bacterium]